MAEGDFTRVDLSKPAPAYRTEPATPSLPEPVKPLLPESDTKGLDRQTQIDLCHRGASRVLRALDSISDAELIEFGKKKPKELAITAGVLIDKAEVLEKQPQKEAIIRDQQAFNEQLKIVVGALIQRGIKIEIPGAPTFEPPAIEVDPVEPPSEQETERFGKWIA